MSKAVVVRKLPLVRKRERIGVASNIRVIVEPQANKSVLFRPGNVKSIVSHKSPPKVEPPPSAQPRSKTRKQIIIKNKNPKVIHRTADPTPESIEKARSLRGIGAKKALIIVGNGPSINEIDLPALTNHSRIDILSINKPDPRLWPTTYWAFFDLSQYRRHKKLWEEYNGTILNSTAIVHQKGKSIQFKYIMGKGFSRDLTKGIYIGRSSVFASMQLALWMDYAETYCFGVDMDPAGINGKLHFFGVNPDVDPELRKKRFTKEAEFYEHAASLLSPEERNRFIFCSNYNKHHFVELYRRVDHLEAVGHILSCYA